LIEHKVKLAIGELTIQLVVARAQIEELQAELSRLDVQEPQAKPNGHDHEEHPPS